MPTYRPLRPGDLLAIRVTDPYQDEAHIVIDKVHDDGHHLLIAGAWRGLRLEIIGRRVGDTHPLPLET